MTKSKGFDINAPLKHEEIDELIYLDANAIIHLLDPSQSRHSVYLNFYQKCVSSGTVFTYSTHVLEEVLKYNRKSYLKQFYKNTNPSITNNFSDSQIRLMNQNLENSIVNIERFLHTDAEKLDFDNINSYENIFKIQKHSPRIHIEDAKHLGIMYENEVNSILTDDNGMMESKGFNIYGASKDIATDYAKQNSNSFIDFNATRKVYK